MSEINKEKALLQMPILTYGTTLLGAYCKFLKLSNTIKSDATLEEILILASNLKKYV